MKLTTSHITRVVIILTLLIAGSILANWLFFPGDKRFLTGDETPKFNTAACLFLSAIALYYINQPIPARSDKLTGIGCSILVILITGLTIAQYIFHTDLGIDQVLLKETHLGPTTHFPGRMAVSTASILLTLSITHLLLSQRKFILLIQIILIAGIGLLSVIFLVYVTRINSHRLSFIRPTALFTSFTLLILYVGSFFSYPLQRLYFSFQQQMLAYFSFAILLLMVVFIFIQTSSQRFTDTAKWVEHTNEALSQNQQIIHLAQLIEMNAREYAISGNPIFLSKFDKSVTAIHQAVLRLQQTTKDNLEQQRRIDSLNELIFVTIEMQKRTIQERNDKGIQVTESVAETAYMQQKMNELQTVAANIEREEQQLLNKRKADNEQSIHNNSRIITVFQLTTGVLLLSAFLVLYRNVEKRNKAEQEIRRLNETLENKVEEKTRELLKTELHFRQILDNLMEGAQIIGFDWKYIYVNDAFLKHAHYSREELIGYTVMEKYPGIEQVPIYDVYQRCFQDRKAIHLENEFVFPDGSIGWFDLSFQPVPEGIFILSMDITERKRSEILLQELNDMLAKRAAELQASNTELERFAYVASHDLQEPLRMVSSFVHLLDRKLDGTLDETSKQYINFAVDGADRMKKLIQDLLQYSRLGTTKESISAVDCNEVLNTVRSVLKLSMEENDATLMVHPLPIVQAVQSQLLQLFQNLVSNAIKYHGDAAPVIEVGYKETKSFYEFYVKDNGIGIDPKFFDKIFIIFQRLHNKTDYSGTGIGLSICKKIVEKHGGTIRVVSAPEKGSTFYFTLPKNIAS